VNDLRQTLSQYWRNIQETLFPWVVEEIGDLSEKQRQLVAALELLRIENHVRNVRGFRGRPSDDRKALARAFVAKAVYGFATTRHLLERLLADSTLRQICGWNRRSDAPGESTFSRAFAQFSRDKLAERVHEAVIAQYQADRLIGHISRDSTEIEVREKPAPKPKPVPQQEKRKRGRPPKGTPPVIKQIPRLERQPAMTLQEMIEELPKTCDIGCKKNSQGYTEHWRGYKLHLDIADGQIPISCILTSASLHDSQAAIPLATMSARRVKNLYDLMDSAYDANAIREYSQSLEHVPIIDHCRRAGEKKAFAPHEARRYGERSAVERVNSRLKEEFGARLILFRGHSKVMTYLMFGILALTADQLIRLVR
jgi:hypothetical protein